ncbi:MAG TPA: efflux RND transporter permease subunit [Pirellulaceae bacterium]|jgi:HME family heavy-metal exporter|nr:efflux RND transporter permease subunit [Pirellulaceae bacterium]
MLNAVIRFSLRNRLLVFALATFLTAYGTWQAMSLPIDVFPDLNRPRVVVMTEAHGLAPEEVETLVTIPIETAVNGATGVEAVRSQSGVGLSVVNIEFDWGTDINVDRQIVTERLSTIAGSLPEDAQPQLMPISSIMGQILIAGMYAEGGAVSPMELRTIADWNVRQRLLKIPGVSQVIVMGGDRKQFQVLVDPESLLRMGVSLHEVEQALEESNQNTSGGYLDRQGPSEYLVRSLGRVTTTEQIERIVVKREGRQSIALSQVARVVEAGQTKRGDSSAYARDEAGVMQGGAAVVLTVSKQPGADTRAVTDNVMAALRSVDAELPEIRILPDLYQQKDFIDRAVDNVMEALRDGGLLVVVILFLFLMNFRTTFITLTAIPLSIFATALVFAAFDLSINTMTLGGLAVAIGELVDDAIVDVENIYRRLRENRHAAAPLHPLLVVYRASCEIRNSIVYGTIIVVLAFVPLFAMSGMEGQLFRPLGVAYVVSLIASLAVSLTVTPALSYALLGHLAFKGTHTDGLLVRFLKMIAGGVMRASLAVPWLVLGLATAATVVAGIAVSMLDRDFLPAFNEGAMQINVVLPPGTSLRTSREVAERVDATLGELEDVTAFVRKTGRAELDEHAMDVNVTEYVATIDPESPNSREEVIQEIEHALADVPGVVIAVEQPLAHLISHMLSGVKAQVAVKLYGEDLQVLRREAAKIQAAMSGVEGIRGLQMEPQVEIPQLRIEADGEKLFEHGLTRMDVNELVETAMQGEVISEVVDGQRRFDLLVRLDEPYREDLQALRRLRIETPDGGAVKLEDVARIYESSGPNAVNREQVSRRVVVQCNVTGRGLVDVVDDIRERLTPIEANLPEGYFIEYGGQFESQQSASRTIAILFCVSLVGIFLVLFTMFRSVNLALQVMIALPTAFIGAVAALYVTDQTLTIAAIVGFISLCGIASRNGILLIDHYLHLVKHEGETWSKEMIVRAGKERMSPVLMTALASGIGLVPLALSAGEPGKEILYPVATVIIGGLISSTALEFLVRPAFFWTLGVGAARATVEHEESQIELKDQSDE